MVGREIGYDQGMVDLAEERPIGNGKRMGISSGKSKRHTTVVLIGSFLSTIESGQLEDRCTLPNQNI